MVDGKIQTHGSDGLKFSYQLPVIRIPLIAQLQSVSRQLDGTAAWRRRPLGEIHYLLLDARYEKLREGGVVRDAALFSAVGIGPDGRRRVLGVSYDPSEAEIHWRAFLDSLIGPAAASSSVTIMLG